MTKQPSAKRPMGLRGRLKVAFAAKAAWKSLAKAI